MFDSLLDKYNDIKAKRENGDGGFTLIELLVVVVIIGILIAIAIPLYLNYQKGAHDKSAQSDLRAAVSSFQQCYTDNSNAYPVLSNTDESASFTLTCGTGGTDTEEKVNLSDGTHMAVTSTASSVTLTAWNTGGHNSTEAKALAAGYTYNSADGGTIGVPAPAAGSGG